MSGSNITFREREEAIRLISERNLLLKAIKTAQRSLENAQDQENTLQDMQSSVAQYDLKIDGFKSRMREQEQAFRRAVQINQPGMGRKPEAAIKFLAVFLTLFAATLLLLWLK